MKDIRELNDYTCDELIAVWERNARFYSECKDIADSFSTEWAINDLLRNVPRCVDYEIGYPGGYMHIKYYASFDDVLSALEWAKSVAYDYDEGIYDLVNFDNCARYADVLNDYRKNISEKDENYMKEYIEKETKNALSAVLDLCVATYNQFDDEYYLADCLLSNGLLDEYYEKDGDIYKRVYDYKIA